ncbi:hypothetical protein M9H77_18313 [Catharanthus roseus]|uniref:Uncharacterized protein n=1 Tax=Catharanthus roseus TaxID=4058 RepID=A0ACC0B743_CATRO|nr:hypothetical protein M9H77_18313 [Catharanthus roseus]
MISHRSRDKHYNSKFTNEIGKNREAAGRRSTATAVSTLASRRSSRGVPSTSGSRSRRSPRREQELSTVTTARRSSRAEQRSGLRLFDRRQSPRREEEARAVATAEKRRGREREDSSRERESRSRQQREPNELGEFGFCVRDEEQPRSVLPVKNDGESLRLTSGLKKNSSQSLSKQALSSLTQPHARRACFRLLTGRYFRLFTGFGLIMGLCRFGGVLHLHGNIPICGNVNRAIRIGFSL